VPKSVSYYLDGISFQLEFYSLMNFAGVSFEGEHTPGVNFTNVLRKAFRCAEKMTDGLTVFFPLLESARAKAARKTLMTLTPAARQVPLFDGRVRGPREDVAVVDEYARDVTLVPSKLKNIKY